MPDLDAIYLGAMIHGIFLSILLCRNNRSNKQANRLLAILIGLITLILWNMYVYKSGLSHQWILIDTTLWATPYLWTPMLYAYVVQMTQTETITRSKLFKHVLPALIIGLTQFPLNYLTDHGIIDPSIRAALYKACVAGLYLQMAFYIYLCLSVLSGYRARLKTYCSATEAINMAWLRNIILIFTIIIFMDMCLNIPSAFFDMQIPFFFNIVLMAEATSIFVIGYLSLSQVEILAGPQDLTPDGSVKAKYRGSPIDDTLGAELATKLDDLMESSKAFKQNDLRLGELADKMGVSPNHLSQIINQHRHKNFYDYVNEYRARSAADDLVRLGKINLTKLAFDSGFNNRVSFNKAFKKYTGSTPTDFVQERCS